MASLPGAPAVTAKRERPDLWRIEHFGALRQGDRVAPAPLESRRAAALLAVPACHRRRAQGRAVPAARAAGEPGRSW